MSHRTWRCIRLYFQHDSAYTDQLDVRWHSPHRMLSRSTVTSQWVDAEMILMRINCVKLRSISQEKCLFCFS
jgi:hypothetical protein